jgi:hypothetical protein
MRRSREATERLIEGNLRGSKFGACAITPSSVRKRAAASRSCCTRSFKLSSCVCSPVTAGGSASTLVLQARILTKRESESASVDLCVCRCWPTGTVTPSPLRPSVRTLWVLGTTTKERSIFPTSCFLFFSTFFYDYFESTTGNDLVNSATLFAYRCTHHSHITVR